MINIRPTKDQGVLLWAQKYLYEHQRLPTSFDPNKCQWIAIDDGKDLLAVIIFHDYYYPARIEMSIASKSPRFCTRKVLSYCFNFCFNIAKVERVYTQVCGNNAKALEWNKRLGFKETAVLPDFTIDLDDKIHDNHVFTMTKKECNWLWAEKAKAA